MTELSIYAAPPEERWRYSQALAEASLLPEAYRRQPSNVLLALESGAALNVAPMVAIQEIHVIKGKPSPSAQLMAALVRRAGHRLRISGDAESATCEIVRHDDPDFTFRSTWTMARAEAAGLLSNDTWKKYPANMLKARAISECCRDACPDVVVGFGYTPEELGDASDTGGAEVRVERADTETSGAESVAVAAESASTAETPAPEPDIEDAVVVDDSEPLAQTNDGLWKALQATLADWMRANDAARPDVLLLVSSVLDREVASTTELTIADAHRVLDALNERAWS